MVPFPWGGATNATNELRNRSTEKGEGIDKDASISLARNTSPNPLNEHLSLICRHPALFVALFYDPLIAALK